jgi:preprotein translocase SecE subunit
MAVAVKTAPENRPGSPPPNPATLSLLGVAYVVACLALLFKVLPDAWWAGWSSAGLTSYTLLGGVLLFCASVALACGLFYVGARLAGAQSVPGVRAGTFVGLCSLLLVLLITRWASLWVESWAYSANNKFTGEVVTAVLFGALLLLALRIFFSKGAQKAILDLEEAGWFSTTMYKANQGQIVRRGTVFGLLLLAGAGIYTLLLHNTLRRFGPDLALYIPFTGSVAVDSTGWQYDEDSFDGLPILDDNSIVPLADRSWVEIRYPGKTRLRVGQKLTVDAYKAGLKELIGSSDGGPRSVVLTSKDHARVLAALDKSPAEFLFEVNRVIHEEVEEILRKGVFPGADTAKQIRAIEKETDLADMTRVVTLIHREAEAHNARTKVALDIGQELDLPIAVLLVDRFAMKSVTAALNPKTHVKVALKNDSKLATGAIVTREEFDAEVERVKKAGLGQVPPRGEDPAAPGGPLRYASLTLLPSIQYTVPLLLIFGAMWFAWRAVNMPAFADFLIATEAEMNKVSWTSQKRLYQDTVVVLVTVFLMAVFLFVVDWGWKEVLQRLNVLYIPPAGKVEKIEQKKW